jgi:hypothetical protein
MLGEETASIFCSMQTSRSSTLVILAHSPAACTEGAVIATNIRSAAEARASQGRFLNGI